MSDNNEKVRISFGRNEIITLLKNTFIMLCITLVAGGILGYVYEITKEPIANMQMQKKQEANQKVFADAVSFSDTIDAINSDAVNDNADITDCIYALDANGDVLGYVIEVLAHGGYGGDIKFQIGITNGGVINGVSITDISETAGLGMRAPEVLAPQFRKRAAQTFEVVKNGASYDNQIDAISSATITSKAVTNGVNAAVVFYNLYLAGGSEDE